MQESVLKVELEIESAWVTIANENLLMDDAIEQLTLLGNQVIEIDRIGRRLRLKTNV